MVYRARRECPGHRLKLLEGPAGVGDCLAFSFLSPLFFFLGREGDGAGALLKKASPYSVIFSSCFGDECLVHCTVVSAVVVGICMFYNALRVPPATRVQKG